MSLSFPLLISAVPLHEPKTRMRVSPLEDSSAKEAERGGPARSVLDSTDSLASGGTRTTTTITGFRECWLSDGGIGSNFPVHLFDGPLPVWPTFAINLIYPDTTDDALPQVISLPAHNNSGWQRTYRSIEKPLALAEVGAFVFAIISTMQNWRDLLQSRAPGFRDRIVPIPLTGAEGGMNLNMPQAVLTAIASKGTQAGLAFQDFRFENHFWIRWRNLASAMQRYVNRVAASAQSVPVIADYSKAYELASSDARDPPSYPYNSAKKRLEAEALRTWMINAGKNWIDHGPDLTESAPRPLPQMQIGPTY